MYAGGKRVRVHYHGWTGDKYDTDFDLDSPNLAQYVRLSVRWAVRCAVRCAALCCAVLCCAVL